MPSTSGDTAVETWTVDSLEHMRVLGIHGVDSLMPLGEIKGIARLPDGGVVVADGRESVLKFFNAEGEYVRTIGEQGSRPDEFSRLTHMMHCGDSLYVLDFPLRHYKVFSMDRVSARTFVLLTDGVGAVAAESACNARSVFINYSAALAVNLPKQSGAWRPPVQFWLSGPTGKTQSSLGEHPASDQWFEKYANADDITDLPLGRVSVVAVGQSRAYIGTADSFAVNVYSMDGSPTDFVRKTGNRQATTSADIGRYKLQDPIGRLASDIKRRKRKWASFGASKYLPAYAALVVDSADNLWVRAQPRRMATESNGLCSDRTGRELRAPQRSHLSSSPK